MNVQSELKKGGYINSTGETTLIKQCRWFPIFELIIL